VSERRHTVTTGDGIELQAWVAPHPSATAVLVLCHGLTTDCHEHGAFPAVRDRALAAGMAVVRFDFRAHGKSGGDNQSFRLAGVRTDIEAVLALVDEQIGADVPIIPVGLSFGGAAAVHAAATRRPCAGLALWYAVVDYDWNYAADSPVPFTHQMRAAVSAEDPEWSAMPVLGTDWYIPSAMLAEAAEDPTFASLCELNIPVLAYHGTRDGFVGMEPLRRAARARPNVELRVARGAGHGFFLWRPWVVRRTVSWAAAAARRANA
jgi:pimeloyl-ACP methyl ester carboxylesterase